MLASLIGALISGEAVEAARRARATAVAYLLAGILCLCGAGFLVGAAYIATARNFGPITAAVSFGIGFVVLGGLVLAVQKVAAAIRKRGRSRFATEFATLAGAAAMAGLPLLLRRGGVSAVIAPLLALVGYAIYRENAQEPPAGDPDRKE
jgi:uncharacterized membrane protein